MHYRKPLRFDDEVDVALVVGAVTRTTFQIAYLLTVGGEARATAVTVHGAVDGARPAGEAARVGARRRTRAWARGSSPATRRDGRAEGRCVAVGEEPTALAGDGAQGTHYERHVVADGHVPEDPPLERADRASKGAPAGPRRQSTDANLSTRSPVSSANSRARSTWSGRGDGDPCAMHARPRQGVVLTETQATKFGGSMLHWVTKPARHPLISPSGARTVTT